jgi:hypothetical protein
MKLRNIADISQEAIQIADILSDFTCKYTLNSMGNYYVIEHEHCIIEYNFHRSVTGYTIRVNFTGISDPVNLRSVMTAVEMSYLLTVARVRRDTESFNKRST